MQHLSDMEITMYAEALAEDREDQIDESLRNHIVECEKCAEEVFDLRSSIEKFHEEKKQNNFTQKAMYISAAAILLKVILLKKDRLARRSIPLIYSILSLLAPAGLVSDERASLSKVFSS